MQNFAGLYQAQAAADAAPSVADRLRAAGAQGEIEKTANEFEAVFLAQMMAPMFEGLKTDGPFGGGHSEQIYRSMLIDHYAQEVATGGGIGIAAQIKAELLKVQEAAQAGAAVLAEDSPAPTKED